MRRTIYNAARAAQSIPPAARTATVTGSSVDMGEHRSALLIVNVGAVTDGTHTVELQESDDNSVFTAVVDEHLQGSEPAVTSTTDARIYEVGYVGSKRYVRAVITVSGAPVTGGVVGCIIQRGFADQPVNRS